MGSGGMSSGLGRGSGSILGGSVAAQQQPTQPQILTQPPQIVPTSQQAQNVNNTNFPDTDTQDFHLLTSGGRQYYLSQTFDIDGQLAIVNYLDPDPERNPQPGDSSEHSISQNLNFNMAHGKPLSPNQQFMKDSLMDNMHNLGQNLLLNRYDHRGFLDSIMKSIGLGDYQNYTNAQLQSALVGTTFTENKFLSTSYNDFKHASAATQSTFLDRAVKITYKAKAGTQALMPGDATDKYGNRMAHGEIILAPNQSMKIVGVNLTNQMVRTQGTRSYTTRRIELIIEVG